MNPGKGRLLAWGSVVVGMVVLLVCVFAFKDRIAEEYWLWRLESGDLDAQKVAAERLADMGSIRAVPQLVELLRNERLAWASDAIKTRVNAVDTRNGVTVLAAGSDQEIKPGLEFLICQGGQFAGLVKVVKVWPDMSGAETLATNGNAEITNGALAVWLGDSYARVRKAAGETLNRTKNHGGTEMEEPRPPPPSW